MLTLKDWIDSKSELQNYVNGELHPQYTQRVQLYSWLKKLPSAIQRQVNGVAWFEHDDDAGGWNTPILLKSFRKIEATMGEQAVRQLDQKLTSAGKRFEAVSDQIGARAKALTEAIAPLINLYSEVELAEIRKRAVGKGVPALFVDWVMAQLQTSNPPRLPTKGDAFNNCGPNTVIGKKLAAADVGISKQRFADHLTVLRRLFEEKGWLATGGSGKSRRRESNFHPDDRLEDYNQPNPAESAGDRDEERRKAAGLDGE
jgi:hypothetical protein